jgi:hypothetical protein
MSDTLARFQWEGGNEQPLPANISQLSQLAVSFRRTEAALHGDFAGYAAYLAAVQNAMEGTVGVTADTIERKAAQAEAEILRHLASIAAQFRILRDLSKGVQSTAEEANARMKAASAKAATKS